MKESNHQFPLKDNLLLSYDKTNQQFRILKSIRYDQLKTYQKFMTGVTLETRQETQAQISMPFWLSVNLAELKTLESEFDQDLWVKLHLQIFIKWAFKLNQMHLEGLVHGDLNPTNLLLMSPHECLIIDFDHAHVEFQSKLGEGTPRYFSPNQFIRGELKLVDEIYSMGLMLLESLLGVHPYEGLNSEELRDDLQGSRQCLKDSLQGFMDKYSHPGLFEFFQRVLIDESIEDGEEFSEHLEIELDKMGENLSQDRIDSSLKNLILAVRVKTLEDGWHYFMENKYLEEAIYWCSELVFLCPHDESYSQKLMLIKLKLQSEQSKKWSRLKQSLVFGVPLVCLVLFAWVHLKSQYSQLSEHTIQLSEITGTRSNQERMRLEDPYQIVRLPDESRVLPTIRIIAPHGTHGSSLWVDSVEVPLIENMFKVTPGEYHVDFYRGSAYDKAELRVDKKGYQWKNLR